MCFCLWYYNVENNQRDMVASGNPRRVRLFGVNLECPDEPDEPSTQDGSSHGGQQPHYQYNYSNSNNLNHNMVWIFLSFRIWFYLFSIISDHLNWEINNYITSSQKY